MIALFFLLLGMLFWVLTLAGSRARVDDNSLVEGFLVPLGGACKGSKIGECESVCCINNKCVDAKECY